MRTQPIKRIDLKVDEAAETDDSTTPAHDSDQEEEPEALKHKGHGRNDADAYRDARKIRVPHESLQPGDA